MAGMHRRQRKRAAERLREDQPSGEAPASVRLQKALAEAGVGSRRKCEELILAGRVEVDGQLVNALGTRVDPLRQQIRVDGDPLKRSRRMYFAVNKPTGVVCTNRDPAGRPRVIDLVNIDERLFPVGRLDASSEGLIIVTNDGELTNNLAHPRYGVEKTYHVQVAGAPTRDQLDQLRQGIHLAEGFVRVAQLQVKKRLKQSTVLEIVLNEGKNREIRRVMARLGHKVLRLKRIAIGTLRLGELPTGAYRPLSVQEVRRLNECAQQSASEGAAGKPQRKKKRPFRPAGSRPEGANLDEAGQPRTAHVARRTSGGNKHKKPDDAVGRGQQQSQGSRAACKKQSGFKKQAGLKKAPPPRPPATTPGEKRPGGLVIEYGEPGEAAPSSGGRPQHKRAKPKSGNRGQSGRKGNARSAAKGNKGKRRPRR